nr:hypothetical protein CFP56_38995 [Quercus suber]
MLPRTIIHTRNTAPMIQNANTAYQLWQILFCASHARLLRLKSLLGREKTYSWQRPLTSPAGPKSWIAVSIRPVMYSTSRMKEPMMTTPGSSRRCRTSTMRMMMKMTVSAPTAIPKGMILRIAESVQSIANLKVEARKLTMESPGRPDVADR